MRGNECRWPGGWSRLAQCIIWGGVETEVDGYMMEETELELELAMGDR